MLTQLKVFLRDTLGIPAAAVLLATGLLAHVVLCLLLRKPMVSAWGLIAPALLGVMIEAYEIWVQYREIGLFAPGNDPVAAILLRHAFDVAKMLLLPGLLVIAGKVLSQTSV